MIEYQICREELEGTQASKEVIDPTDATLWFANNEMKPENKLSEHLGKNEKTKVIVKVSTRRGGQPVWRGTQASCTYPAQFQLISFIGIKCEL